MTMIRRILCPTDLSESSRRAFRSALTLAAQLHAEVTVAHVSSPAEAADAARLEGELRQLALAAESRGVPTRTLLIEGEPTAGIVGLSESLEADMIVMGTHGRSGLDRWVLGSVAETVVQEARCPVLTVAPGSAPQALDGKIGRILCAESLSRPSATVALALAMARQAEAQLLLFHAVEELPPGSFSGLPPFEYGPGLAAWATDQLRAMIPPADQGSHRVEVAVVPGRAHEEILLRAKEERADLIVVGGHLRNPVGFSPWGSTARQVARHAGCPVLTVPAGVRRTWVDEATEQAGALRR